MKRSFVQRMLADYPNWHDKPFQLATAEIKNPYLVFEEFFERYSLTNLRVEMKEMMTDALRGEGNDDPTRYICFCENLEKLTEACYVLHHNVHDSANFLDEDETELPITQDDKSLPGDLEEENEENLRPALLQEIVRQDPLKGIHRTFYITDLEMLDEYLEDWVSIALCNEYSSYETASNRARLISYVAEVRRLFEALYALRETAEIKRFTGHERLSPGLFGDLRGAPEFKFLTVEQLQKPMTVVNAFYERFSYRYAWLELWDLLDAVISYEGDDPKPFRRLNILVDYDCMAALLLAGKLLSMDALQTIQEKNQSQTKSNSDVTTGDGSQATEL